MKRSSLALALLLIAPACAVATVEEGQGSPDDGDAETGGDTGAGGSTGGTSSGGTTSAGGGGGLVGSGSGSGTGGATGGDSGDGGTGGATGGTGGATGGTGGATGGSGGGVGGCAPEWTAKVYDHAQGGPHVVTQDGIEYETCYYAQASQPPAENSAANCSVGEPWRVVGPCS